MTLPAIGGMPANLTWLKTAVHRKTDLARERIWRSRCGQYRVVEAVSVFSGLPIVYYAEVRRRTEDGREAWDVLSKHVTHRPRASKAAKRAMRAAFRRCERHDAIRPGSGKPR